MIYGCIGEKLGHSFSKEIHNRLFDYEYELCEVARDKLQEFMTKRDFRAINVTIPYKVDVIPYLYEISETAKKIGAVNTIVNRDGKLYGYNTDFSALTSLIERNGICIKNKKVLILGSGGTSKTAYAVSLHLGAKEIYVVSRSESDGYITYETAVKEHSDADIIINTTPVGMYPNIAESAVDINFFPNLSGVVDAIYNPLRSKLVCDARRKGISAIGGLYMLVAQAAYAAEKFTGQSVPQEKIEQVYRSLVLEKQNIVLVGMPGSGKSTVAKMLAKELGMQFVDSDDEIVKKTGKTIPEIFKEKGESGFRELEGAVIAEISKKQHSVIATGGGAILNRRNIELLSENGRIYFIDRPLSEIAATSDRPLSSNREDLKKRYSERYDIYLKSCDKHIKADGSAKDIAKIIKEDFQNEATCD